LLVCFGGRTTKNEHTRRQVPYEEGLALANKWGCAFVETSAKQNEDNNIGNLFSLMFNFRFLVLSLTCPFVGLFLARVFLLLTEAIQKETMPEENKSRCTLM
jgi:hypothetical protein